RPGGCLECRATAIGYGGLETLRSRPAFLPLNLVEGGGGRGDQVAVILQRGDGGGGISRRAVGPQTLNGRRGVFDGPVRGRRADQDVVADAVPRVVEGLVVGVSGHPVARGGGGQGRVELRGDALQRVGRTGGGGATERGEAASNDGQHHSELACILASEHATS